MATERKELSEAGREQIALALVLLKDFKTEGRFDIDINTMVIELAQHLGVMKEYEKVMVAMPPMRIEQRYPDIS